MGWFFLQHRALPFGDATWLSLTITISIAVLFICIDILSPRKKLAVFSGTFMGLIVGMLIAYALSFAVRLLVERFEGLTEFDIARREAIIAFANVTVGITCCYLAISFILQTKDDFRFIIPYVEFTKQVRGPRPMIVDTSILIDGRLPEIAGTGIIDTRLLVPRFVLQELQTVADSADKLKRNRGRRGLEILNKLQGNRKVEVILYEWSRPGSEQLVADEKLMSMAKELNGRLLTNDYNLSKVAQVRGIDAVNLNDLASCLRPVALPGEKMMVHLVKLGEESSQAVGYLEDGTMVVVDNGRNHLNEDVEVTVTNALQTSTGRMIFARLGDNGGKPRRHPDKPHTSESPSHPA
ncbi:MAG: PIN domain-containing protein [Tepidisphaeraceae bacterium]